MSADLVEHEQRWLPHLAPRLPLPIPVPVRVGEPGLGYPWSWSVMPWLAGRGRGRASPPADPFVTAEQLGAFLHALHVARARGRASEPVPRRSARPIARRRYSTASRLLGDRIDGAATLSRAGRCSTHRAVVGPHACGCTATCTPRTCSWPAVGSPASSTSGTCSGGDRATDLSVAWMLLPAAARDAFRVAVGSVDDDTSVHARGWALALALTYLAGSGDNPLMGDVGRRTLDVVLRDPAG